MNMQDRTRHHYTESTEKRTHISPLLYRSTGDGQNKTIYTCTEPVNI